MQGVIWKGVDVDLNLLAHLQVCNVCLFRVGIDPGRRVVDDAEYRHARGEEASELNALHLRRGTSDWRLEDGVVEVALRLIERRLRLPIGRKTLDREIGFAQQLI